MIWFSTNISNSIFPLIVRAQKHNALMFRRTTLTKLSEAGVLWHVLVIEGKEWQKVGWDYNWENETTAPIWKCLQAGWLDQASTTNDFVGTYRQSSRRRVPIKSISSWKTGACATLNDDRQPSWMEEICTTALLTKQTWFRLPHFRQISIVLIFCLFTTGVIFLHIHTIFGFYLVINLFDWMTHFYQIFWIFFIISLKWFHQSFGL